MKRAALALGLLGLLVLGGLGLHHRDVLPLPLSVTPSDAAVIVVLVVLTVVLSGARWVLQLRELRIQFPLRRAAKVVLTSHLASMMTVLRLGQLLRAGYLRHRCNVRFSIGASATVVDGLLSAYMKVIAVALFALQRLGENASRIGDLGFLESIAIAFAPVAIAGIFRSEAMLHLLGDLVLAGRGSRSQFLYSTKEQLGPRILGALAVEAAVVFGQALQVLLISGAMGCPVDPWFALALTAVPALASLAPLGGLGFREAGFVAAFVLYGMSAAQGFWFGLGWIALREVPMVLLGLLAWWRYPPPKGAAGDWREEAGLE